MQNDPNVNKPIELTDGGAIDLYMKIRNVDDKEEIEIQNYRIAIFDIPDNDNDIKSIRYDYDLSQKYGKGDNWDDELKDNPQHPLFHMHINFMKNNDCRMAVGRLCPILALRTFDHWYYNNIR